MGEMADDIAIYGSYADEPKTLSWQQEQNVASGFWRDKSGKLHRINKMELHHIKNIINMLKTDGVDIPHVFLLECEFQGGGKQS